ncbi:MAG TPA: SDR family oxidoreductase [Longimicrobiales bacterium]|nr:SDR family oxidoreductase [Longimicrobiales bacterium]
MAPAEGELNGQRALITGGSGGIGLAIARVLRSAGAEVLLVARAAGRLQRAAADSGAEPYAADVSSVAEVERLAAAVLARWDHGPDLVINAAGAFALAPLAETTVESFDQQIAANLRSVFLQIRTWLPHMLRRGSGHIVTIGSIAGRVAFPANGAYSASKFGVRGLHAVLTAELRGTGVRATLIEPAATATMLWDAVDREEQPDLPAPTEMLPPMAVAQAVLYAVAQPAEVAVSNLMVQRS